MPEDANRQSVVPRLSEANKRLFDPQGALTWTKR